MVRVHNEVEIPRSHSHPQGFLDPSPYFSVPPLVHVALWAGIWDPSLQGFLHAVLSI